MKTELKIEVCSYCSGIDVKELGKKVKVKTNCIGKCSKKHPEFQGKVYGFLNGKFVVCDNQEDFLNEINQLDVYVATKSKNHLVDAFLENIVDWKQEHEILREICLQDELIEELKWGQPCYTHNGNNVVIIGGFKNYIALSFFKGALLKNENGILIQQTKNVQAGRQLRFQSLNEIVEKEMLIKAYLKEAIEIEKAGVKMPVVEKEELNIPEELQMKFNQNPAFANAFYALTPGRQRGYVFFFTGAKKSETRVARIEKYTLKIMNGLGIDD